jgi:hypothetical protein
VVIVDSNLDSGKLFMAVLSRLLSTKRTKAAQARVEARHKAGLCKNKKQAEPGSDVLVDCDTRAGKRRGDCDACVTEFYRVLASFGDDRQAAAEYEAKAIREGLILAEGETRQLNKTSLLRRKGA